MKEISEKKKAIFESTLDLVVKHGFHGTPMSLVAKNAGVAAGTIYHYFESKDQLIGELFNYNKSRITEIIDTVIEENISPREKFFNIWFQLYEFYNQNVKVLVFFEQYVNSPYNTSKSPNNFRGQLYDFFKDGVAKGLIKDVKPEILIVITMNSIITTAKLNNFGSIPLSYHDITRILDIVWDGISI